MNKGRAIRALARAYGLQLSHRDGRGRVHRPSSGALVAVLRALGAPVDSADDAISAAGRQAPLVVVAWDGKVDLPVGDDAASWVLRLEDGTERRASERIDRGRLPLGYHDLVRTDGTSIRIISAPMRAPAPSGRGWGVYLPLYALHSERSVGIGDLTDLEALLFWTNKLGGAFVGTLPLYASFLDEPPRAAGHNARPDPSPYAPVSRLFYNEIFVDPQRTPEFEHGLAARELMSSPGFAEEITDVRRDALVDHARVYRLKRRVLELLADVADTSRINAFAEAERLAADYATFRARIETTSDGPERLRAERYHLYAQLVAHEQLAAVAAAQAGGGLHLDLPLGVHPDGFDAYRFDDLFAHGVSVGAPPDDLAPEGQDWGFRPLHPGRTAADGHAYFAAVVGKAMRTATVLRVDHILGLHRQYWIADGMPSGDGVYVRYPAEELYAVLVLEAHRAQTTIVGEDLGTLPPQVRPAMRRHGILSTYVLQFSTCDEQDEPIAQPPRGVLACVNTHDTQTFAAFWGELDPSRRRAISACLALPDDAAAAQVFRAVVGYLGGSDALLVQVSLEDLWGEVQPQNVPGTTQDERPNWRRKARLSLEQITACRDVVDTLAHVARARERSETATGDARRAAPSEGRRR